MNIKLKLTLRVVEKMRAYKEAVGSREFTAYGITDIEDPLLVTDVYTVKHEASMGSFETDTDDLAKTQYELLEKGLEPFQYSRIWIHTHPGSSKPSPSGEDRGCMTNAYGDFDHAVMLIFDEKIENSYAELQYGGRDVNLPIMRDELDVTIVDPDITDNMREEWKKEAREKSSCKTYTPIMNHYANNYRSNLDKVNPGNCILPHCEDEKKNTTEKKEEKKEKKLPRWKTNEMHAAEMKEKKKAEKNKEIEVCHCEDSTNDENELDPVAVCPECEILLCPGTRDKCDSCGHSFRAECEVCTSQIPDYSTCTYCLAKREIKCPVCTSPLGRFSSKCEKCGLVMSHECDDCGYPTPIECLNCIKCGMDVPDNTHSWPPSGLMVDGDKVDADELVIYKGLVYEIDQSEEVYALCTVEQFAKQNNISVNTVLQYINPFSAYDLNHSVIDEIMGELDFQSEFMRPFEIKEEVSGDFENDPKVKHLIGYVQEYKADKFTHYVVNAPSGKSSTLMTKRAVHMFLRAVAAGSTKLTK